MATSTDWRSEPAPAWDQSEIPRHSVEGYRYTDPTFAQAEWDAMWTKVWLLLGRAGDIANPGDVQVEDVGPESFMMIRQTDGSIRALYNVCQHRGSRLVFADRAAFTQITCPYHSWTYDLDGRLVAVQDPEDFSGGDPCERLRLVEVPCETFAGWVWVNMDPDCRSLQEYLGPVWDDWQMWQPEEWRRASAISTWVPCNWKVIQDNFCESYHLLTVHPQLTANIEEGVGWTRFDLTSHGHHRMIMQAAMPSRRQPGGPSLGEPLTTQLAMWGLDPADFAGREYDTRPTLQRRMREEGPARGYRHYEGLRDAQLTDPHHYNVFPNISVTFGADSVLLQRMRPHPTDPQRCRFDHWTYVSQAAIDNGIFRNNGGRVVFSGDAEVRMIEYGSESMGPIADQDIGITSGQQLGLRSRGFQGASLADQEGRIANFHHVIDDYLAGRRP